ncbi:alpha-ribazole phosphatase [Enterococcus sp. 7F3_DIV0205]|uniref:phosphoglycerate mutase (2,3-diphosphoglycerate-dependent) n=1 Tax=Candidatus Enterococcus palustris TaxID=1834189 RepID=A0AAQ3W7D9_9ENTE|nr:histidine phosphatase family protein [Enterococcus sp. 7F3_DIV0205]OTN85374.1 hypothetical protein A5821_001320 [Enterococcus sp. 7F3_DIV0205]
MIYLIRHGETLLNQEKKFYGSLDVSLTETGKKQSRQIAEKLKEIYFSNIYVSQLKRTLETAEIVRPEEQYYVLSELNEKSFGAWEGLSADQIEASYKKQWQAWLDAPLEKAPPEAESFKQFKHRVLHGFSKIEGTLAENPQTDILIVGHLGVLRVLDHYFNHYSTDFWSCDYQQGMYTMYRYENNSYQLEGRNN